MQLRKALEHLKIENCRSGKNSIFAPEVSEALEEDGDAPEISGVFRCTKINCTGNTGTQIFVSTRSTGKFGCNEILKIWLTGTNLLETSGAQHPSMEVVSDTHRFNALKSY